MRNDSEWMGSDTKRKGLRDRGLSGVREEKKINDRYWPISRLREEARDSKTGFTTNRSRSTIDLLRSKIKRERTMNRKGEKLSRKAESCKILCIIVLSGNVGKCTAAPRLQSGL